MQTGWLGNFYKNGAMTVNIKNVYIGTANMHTLNTPQQLLNHIAFKDNRDNKNDSRKK